MIKPKDILTPTGHFTSTVYTIEKPEFFAAASAVSDELLEVSKKAHSMNEAYPFVMSGSLIGIPEIQGLEQFIAQSAWAILDNQGYRMNDFMTYVSELWVQEHFKYSGMEQHVHSHGVVVCGFYFLKTPEEGCIVEFHDPRPSKVHASLPFKDMTQVTDASNSLFIKPVPGMLIFSNSWLPHSFTRNASDESVKFIHFNVSVKPAEHPTGPIIV